MTDSPTSLYSAWFGALPQMFRAMMPGDAAAGAAPAPSGGLAGSASALPFPVDQVATAMGALDGMLRQLYHAYLPLLAEGGITESSIKALAGAGTDMFNRLLGAAPAGGALPGVQGMDGLLTQLAQPWSALLGGLVPGSAQGNAEAGTQALQIGLDRVFGGLGEAFGLGPGRELSAALRHMLQTGMDKQRAQFEYFGLVAEAWNTGTQRLLAELKAMGARGERIESMIAFIRLWAKSVDGPMHDAMQSERGLAITAKVIRASSQHRERLQQAVGLASEALHLPTRADVDGAYREIQELKRELRRLKRQLPPAAVPKQPARLQHATEQEE